MDLDGTLLRTDLVWESLVRLLKQKPLNWFCVPVWLLRGRACLKAQVASRVRLDPATLPYHEQVLDFLRAEKRQGRRLVLATASDLGLAQQVAAHLGLFDEVLASNGKTNLRGHCKSQRLVERFGVRGFDYAGNSRVDLPVWEQARQAIVVGGQALEKRAAQKTEVSRTFGPNQNILHAIVRALRPHQYVKNFIRTGSEQGFSTITE